MAKTSEVFYKLGPLASMFHDPKIGLTLAGNKPAKTTTAQLALSKKARTAVSNQHIIEVSEEEYTKMMKANGYTEEGEPIKAPVLPIVKKVVEDEDEEDEDEDDEDDVQPKAKVTPKKK